MGRNVTGKNVTLGEMLHRGKCYRGKCYRGICYRVKCVRGKSYTSPSIQAFESKGKKWSKSTVCKLSKFSVTQISCEIKVGESTSEKSGGYEFWFLWIIALFKAEIHQINKIQSPQNGNFITFKFYKFIIVKFEWQKNPEIYTLWSLKSLK